MVWIIWLLRYIKGLCPLTVRLSDWGHFLSNSGHFAGKVKKNTRFRRCYCCIRLLDTQKDRCGLRPANTGILRGRVVLPRENSLLRYRKYVFLLALRLPFFVVWGVFRLRKFIKMHIRREIDRVLLNWKQQETRKPLLLRGARQVGKSTARNSPPFTSFRRVRCWSLG